MIITHSNATKKDSVLEKIDAIADAARTKVVGDPIRVKEYEVSQQEAQAYKDAGYAGTVPQSVKSWAEAKEWTAQQAADDILAASARWYAALYGIRDARLKAKENIRNAGTWSVVESTFSAYEAAIARIMQEV